MPTTGEIERSTASDWTALGKQDLIALLELGETALNLEQPAELVLLLTRLADHLPVEQLASAAFSQGADGSPQLLAIHNLSYPDEWAAAFRHQRYPSRCPMLAQSGTLQVMSWSYEQSRHLPALRQMVDDAGQFGVQAGLCGILKPQRNRIGVLCSLSGREVMSHVRHQSFLRHFMPHFQLAQSRVLAQHPIPPGADRRGVELTKREQDVLRWLKAGKTNWEISRILELSESTVKFHVGNLVSKLGAHNRAHAVALAGDTLPRVAA